jgi:hypothetical protein
MNKNDRHFIDYRKLNLIEPSICQIIKITSGKTT